MFYYSCTRRNGIAYLLWRWLLKNNGAFQADLDAWYFGPSRGMNDYESLAKNYKKSDVKPDKQYSILPTVLDMVGDCTGKRIIDVGCGSGFFTVPLAEQGALRVYGIDNSEAQLKLASEVSNRPAVTYALRDIFTTSIAPQFDVIVVPFVANYARSTPILQHLFQRLHGGLSDGGKVVFVFDLPNGKSLQKFGATKMFLGPRADETPIEINLFKENKNICTLTCMYYTPETIERLLRTAGFTNINWHKPIVSLEGISAMGAEFWDGYTDDPELGYLTAEK
ncbi:MAG: class I SAM-dependent methyltransferase [Patescibacteria group bacterium]